MKTTILTISFTINLRKNFPHLSHHRSKLPKTKRKPSHENSPPTPYLRAQQPSKICKRKITALFTLSHSHGDTRLFLSFFLFLPLASGCRTASSTGVHTLIRSGLAARFSRITHALVVLFLSFSHLERAAGGAAQVPARRAPEAPLEERRYRHCARGA